MWRLPIDIVKFWYFDAPLLLLGYFFNINKAFSNLMSLPLMLKTFFRPWKNEYREGLVGFSIFMGIAFKSILIFVFLILFLGLMFLEFIFLVLFLLFPLIGLYLTFFKI